MSASSGFQKVKCLIDMATCVGGETAKCAQKCGVPLVSCVKTAIFGGKMSDVPACFKTFVGCATQCAQTVPEQVDESLIDGAIVEFHQTFPEANSFADCIKAEKDCMSASSGLQKIKCLVDLATCVGGETAKCAQKCGPPLVSCVKTAIFGGKMSDVPACFKTFIGCATECAKSNDELLIETYRDAVLAESTNGPVEECTAKEKMCMDQAPGIFAKLKCIIALGKCLATELGECGQPCISPFIGCVSKHILDPVGALHCY